MLKFVLALAVGVGFAIWVLGVPAALSINLPVGGIITFPAAFAFGARRATTRGTHP
jgi:hypothetical protein